VDQSLCERVLKILQLVVVGLLSFALFPVRFGQVAQKQDQAAQAEQELKRLEDEWLGSYLRGDKQIFDRIVANDFTSTDESAKVRDKAQERELVQAPPASVKTSLTNEDVRCMTSLLRVPPRNHGTNGSLRSVFV